MHLPRLLPAALVPLLLVLAAAGARAQTLEVHFLDVGQGDSTLIVGPTGTTFLLDGGEWGEGSGTVVPRLQALGISSLDYVGVSHYHADHVGGLDEVWNAGYQASVAYDRGTFNEPGTNQFSQYASTYAGVRQAATPGLVVDLGGGATLTCLVVEGDLMGGGSVNIAGSSQWENSASVAWRLEYGDFDMFLGGDLTGGGNSTADVESSVGPICGDVDVYLVSHHGSRTSSNASFVAAIQPEFAMVSCGSANQYGFPKQEVLDRLNEPQRAIPVWCTTDGTGAEGFVDAGGSVTLSTDGVSYSVTAADGTTFEILCDENAVASREIVVGEFLADPSATSDADGEWVEITGTDSGQAALGGVEVTDLGFQGFTVAAEFLLDRGEPLLIAADGLPQRNGGVRPAMVWPAGSFSLANSVDTVALRDGGNVLDQVDYSTSWPGGSGVSAERRDLLAAPTSGNFADAVSTFGAGDKGTPGEVNDADVTNWSGGGSASITILTPPVIGQQLDMEWSAPGESGKLYQGWITLSTTPGFDLNGTHVPANLDAAYRATSGEPGWSGFVPPSETMFPSIVIPNDPNLRNLTIYAIFLTYENVAGQGINVRQIATPAFMVIS